MYWPLMVLPAALMVTWWQFSDEAVVEFGIAGLSTHSELPWTTYLFIPYFIGVLLQFSRLLRDYILINRWKTKGEELISGPLYTVVSNWSRDFGLKSMPSLRLVQDLAVPMVVGVLKPTLLFPASLMTHLSPDELENIVLHELSHIKRHDYFWNLLMSTIEAILFFNPFVWWLNKEIRKQREASCDLQAAQLTQNPKALATALLTIEELMANPRLAMSLNSQGQLAERIHLLLNVRRSKKKRIDKVAWALIGCLPMFFTIQQNDWHEQSKEKQYQVSFDSITVPGFEEAIHSLEFESAAGEIKDVKINNEPITLTNPERVHSIKEKMSETSVSTNRFEEYQTGLGEKYEARKGLRQSREDEEDLIEERVSTPEKIESRSAPEYNLAYIDGYQYGKSLDTVQRWLSWTLGERQDLDLDKKEVQKTQSYFLQMPVDEEGKTVGDVIVIYDRSSIGRSRVSYGYSEEYIENEIEQLLLDYGLIRSSKSYALELSNDELIVNGNKQPIKMHRLFRARYMDMTRKNPSSKFNYQIFKNQIR